MALPRSSARSLNLKGTGKEMNKKDWSKWRNTVNGSPSGFQEVTVDEHFWWENEFMWKKKLMFFPAVLKTVFNY